MHGGTVKELFNVLTPRDAFARIEPYLTGPRATERLPVERALGRVLAEDLRSPGDLPSFRRSTMDGFAVRAADTFGASEGLPAYLTVVGEVFMGQAPTVSPAAVHELNHVFKTSATEVSASEGSNQTKARSDRPGTANPTAMVTGRATANVATVRSTARRTLS